MLPPRSAQARRLAQYRGRVPRTYARRFSPLSTPFLPPLSGSREPVLEVCLSSRSRLEVGWSRQGYRPPLHVDPHPRLRAARLRAKSPSARVRNCGPRRARSVRRGLL